MTRFSSHLPRFVLSFADTKLAEHRIKDLLHIYDTDHFTESAQCLVKVNRNVLRRQSVCQSRSRAIA
jgi:hypothetical protein